MPFCWPSCSLLFCLQLFSLSLLFFYRLVVWDFGQGVNLPVPALHCRSFLIIIIIIDVNLFNNIYPYLNGNQSSEYYDCPKFNKLSMNSNTDLLLLNFNITSIGVNFDIFNCFTKLLNKKIDILNFSESWLNDNNKNLYTIQGYDAFHNVRCDGRRGGGLSVYISNVFKSEVIHPYTISVRETSISSHVLASLT